MPKKVKYGAEDITMLEGLEPVRENPGWYLGNVQNRMFQCFREAIDNSIDEWMHGVGKEILIEINTKQNSILIADNGRGIPVDFHEKAKMPALTVVLTKLNAGAKFGGGKQYTISGGVHGVGISCVNAVSSRFDCWSLNNGKYWMYQSFKDGNPTKKSLQRVDPPKRAAKYSGTIVKFKPNPKFFGDHANIPVNKIKAWLKDIQYLCAGLRFVLYVDKERTIYKNDKGLAQYVQDLIKDKGVSRMGQVFSFESKDRTVQVAMAWTSATEEMSLSFVNNIYTKQGGTHVKGFVRAFDKAIKQYKPANLKSAKAKNVKPSDLRTGLLSIVSVKVRKPSFDSQTKDCLDSNEAIALVEEALLPELKKWFQQNSNLVNRVYSYAIKLRHEMEKFQKATRAIRDLNKFEGSSGRIMVDPPNRYIAAPDVKREEREIFIVEGDSAKGTLKDARFRHQEVLALSGKIPNAIKSKTHSMQKNPDIKNLIKVVGAGILKNCAVSKCRAAKVVFMMDADPDGYHITALGLAFCCEYMRPLLESGMIYIVNAPLYACEYKGKKYYGASMDKIRDQIPKSGHKGLIFTRFKGWGEASSDDLETIAMDRETRKLYRVRIDEDDIETIRAIMGQETTARKELLGLEEDDA